MQVCTTIGSPQTFTGNWIHVTNIRWKPHFLPLSLDSNRFSHCSLWLHHGVSSRANESIPDNTHAHTQTTNSELLDPSHKRPTNQASVHDTWLWKALPLAGQLRRPPPRRTGRGKLDVCCIRRAIAIYYRVPRDRNNLGIRSTEPSEENYIDSLTCQKNSWKGILPES